jgi:hypothetical protein
MANQEAKKRLFEQLDKGAFQPVLRTSERDVPESKRDKLEHVKRATASERERFQNYDTAEKMYQMYRDDLTSQAADDVNRDLEDLDLPKLADCQQQVERTAKELGIR